MGPNEGNLPLNPWLREHTFHLAREREFMNLEAVITLRACNATPRSGTVMRVARIVKFPTAKRQNSTVRS